MKHIKQFILAAVLGLVAIASSVAQVPFMSQGTTNVAVTASAQTLALSTFTVTGATQKQVVLTNVGTQTVFLRWDATPVTLTNGLPVLANSQIVVSMPNAVTATTVISASTGSTLYATVGAGQ